MPDFDTRKPQEPNEPSRLRTQLVAHKHRIQSMANRLRSFVLANRLRPLLIAYVLLLLMVGVPIGLRLYSTTWLGVALGAETVTCDQFMLTKVGECHTPTVEPYFICMAASRDEVESSDGCRTSDE